MRKPAPRSQPLQHGAVPAPSPRSIWARLAAVALVAGLLAPAAWAQGGEMLNRLRMEIERTQHVLTRAREVLEQHGNPRALEQLRFAVHLQEQAIAIATGPTDRLIDFQRALELTRRARMLAERALNIGAQQAQLEQRAQQLLEQVMRALEMARDGFDHAPGPQAERLFEIAQRRLEQAREAFHEQRFQEALDMANDVRRMLENLMQGVADRRMPMLFDGTRRLLERATAAVENHPSDRAAQFLERARELMERAESQMAAGRPDAAARLLEQSRDLALRALRLTEGPLDTAQVDRILQETDSWIHDVADQVRDTGDPDALRMMDTALEHLDRARSFRAAGQLRRALAEARVARNLARRAAQHAGLDSP